MSGIPELTKIQLNVLGLSSSPASGNAYALILKESDGNRRLPIVIGAFEAQAIALEMEGVIPPRPMSHDLMKSIIDCLGATLIEVIITELSEGTFYSKLVFDIMGMEIDARPSDAIALAVRCGAPIFVYEDVLEEAGIIPPDSIDEADDENIFKPKTDINNIGGKKPNTSLNKVEQLKAALDKAIQTEDYERAAALRDEISKIESLH